MAVRRMFLAALIAALPALAQTPEGFGIANATQPEEGLLLGGQPTAKQLKEAAKAGYRTVIDLRDVEEDRGFDEAKAARKAKLEYTNIPVTLATLDAPTIKYFLTVLSNAERPALIHCGTGGRAGALYYSWLVLEQGVPEAQALEQARAAGLHSPDLEEQVQALVDGLKASRRPRP